ncbi:MAG: hypothetical protein ACFB50_17795 [Rubrobacteraceae bacterium]
MEKILNKVTQLTAKFIRSPVLLLGSLALVALIKVLADPDRRK